MVLNHHQRYPGFFERYYICRNINGYYTNFNITAEYSERITPTVLSNALRSLILKNPSFAVNFFRIGLESEDSKLNGGNFIVRPVDMIRFDDIIAYKDISRPFNEEILEDVDAEVCPMNESKPLWRLIIHQFGDLQYVTFYCDHALFDGNSGAYFHEDLIKEIAAVHEDSNLEFQDILFDYSQNIKDLLPILPSNDKMTNLYDTSFYFAFITLAKEFFVPKWLIRLYNSYFDSYCPNLFKYPIFTHKPTKKGELTKFKIINLTSPEINKVLNFIRSKNLTLTPFLTTVGLQSIQKAIIPHISRKKHSMNASIIVNGRRYFPEKVDQLKYGVHVSACEIILGPFKSTSKRFVDLIGTINYISKKLNNQIESKFGFKYAGLLKYINVWRLLESKLGNLDTRSTLEVSNLGIKKIKSHNLSVKNLWFSQNIGTSCHFGFSMICTDTNGLNIVLGYLDEIDKLNNSDTKRKVIDEFCDVFKQNLLEYTEPEFL